MPSFGHFEKLNFLFIEIAAFYLKKKLEKV